MGSGRRWTRRRKAPAALSHKHDPHRGGRGSFDRHPRRRTDDRLGFGQSPEYHDNYDRASRDDSFDHVDDRCTDDYDQQHVHTHNGTADDDDGRTYNYDDKTTDHYDHGRADDYDDYRTTDHDDVYGSANYNPVRPTGGALQRSASLRQSSRSPTRLGSKRLRLRPRARAGGGLYRRPTGRVNLAVRPEFR